jgi:hypothetical protein
MGIKVEFNPDLALREYIEFEKKNRLEEECIPKHIEIGTQYIFLKKGQRNYYLEQGELVPLVTTTGSEQISKPVANIQILEVTHFLKEGNVWSRGKYIVKELC